VIGDSPTPLQNRITAGGLARASIASAAIVLVLGWLGDVLDLDRQLSFGHDLIPSYVAGRIVASGDASHLYDPAACETVGRAVMVDANLSGNPRDVRWLNPGFFALLFAPLAQLPYRWALLVWMSLNAALFGGTMRALVENRTRIAVLLFVGLVAASCPFLLAFEHQQNSFLSLAILTAAVVAWRGGRPFAAGLLVGLLAYKPQLAAAIGVALVLSQGRRALLGLIISASSLLLLGEVFAPGSTLGFLRSVPPIVRAMQSEPVFNWGRQVTPTSFWCALLGPGRAELARGLGIASSLTAMATVAWIAWRARGRGQEAIDQLIASTILLLPLSAIYFMDYDLLLLAIPASLMVRKRLVAAALVCAAALWVAIYVNLASVEAMHLNLVVIVLSTIAISTLARDVWRSANTPKVPLSSRHLPDASAAATIAPTTS
jgi:hypothetical protein